jgi:hypothetical protein
MAGKDPKQLSLPTPQSNLDDRMSRKMLRETSDDVNELKIYPLENEPLLVTDQRAAYNTILNQINRQTSGTGKTFVIILLLAKIRH